MNETRLVEKARQMLETVTPLKRDCGALCGAACCKDSDDGEVLGMELFPGEKALYASKADWYKLYPAPGSCVFVCKTFCPREQRPLACRIFPLAPYVKNGRLIVRMDPRSAPVCPLFAHGKRGLDPAFVKTVTEAMTLLWENEAMRTYFKALTEQIDLLTQEL